MTLIELQYLVALGDELHFGRAAARCYVSQPTLSMAIRKLENDLDVQLFERNKSGIKITKIGQQIIAQATRVIDRTTVIKALAEAAKDQLIGTLHIGLISTLAPYLLPALIPQLRIMANKLNLRIVEGSSIDLLQKLRACELDVVLVSQPFTGVDVLTQDFFEEPLIVLMPLKHPLAAQQTLRPIDLKGQNFLLLHAGNCLRDQVLDIFSPLGESDRPIFIETCSIETLRNMVAAGLGITIIPISAVSSTLPINSLLATRSLTAPIPTRTIALAWRTSFPRHKIINVLRSAVQICTWQFTTAHDNSRQGLLVENDNW
jgi:LysR family transcriptional regulator, hydrogen peroxide-inducible genes activator